MASVNEEKNRFNVDIPNDNVCMLSETFSPEDTESVDATRFIYETSPAKLKESIVYSGFGCHIVTGGRAILVTENKEYEIGVGDVFFTFPMIPFGFKKIEGLKYLYVNFVGSGAESLLESVEISRGKAIRRDLIELIDIWFLALARCNSDNLRLLAKGVLYYTLAIFPTEDKQESQKPEENIAEVIRKSIDTCYHNEDLSIEYYARKFGYNSKYLSRKFATEFGTTFSEYLKSCRINRARELLENSTKSIQEIATLVGYHDPLYFSKVFKGLTGESPTKFRKIKK